MDSIKSLKDVFDKIKKCCLIYTVPSHNKHIFVRPKKVCLLWEKCLFGEKVLIMRSGGFRILGIPPIFKIALKNYLTSIP